MKNWLIQLWKDGLRWRFLHWAIPVILPGYHLGKNSHGGGRKKSVPEAQAAKEFYDREEKERRDEGNERDPA